MRAYDKRHGWRKPAHTVSDDKQTIDTWRDERWTRPIAPGDVVPAVVVSAPKTGAARVRFAKYHADIEKPGYSWALGSKRTGPADLFQPGDVIEVAVTKLDEANGAATATLDQTP